MKIFIDFDDVIFNTKQFIADREEIYKKYGATAEIFNRYVQKLKKESQDKSRLIQYNLDDHIKDILLQTNINPDELKIDLSKVTQNAKKYVFDEFKEFAKKVGKENLYLISYGNIEFQTRKIKSSGVEEYFLDIIITDGKKSESLPENLIKNENENYYFIDDRAVHLEDIKKRFPKINTILMVSNNGRHCDERKDEYCDDLIKSFEEMEKILESDGR